jgi:hypothetical protein
MEKEIDGHLEVQLMQIVCRTKFAWVKIMYMW